MTKVYRLQTLSFMQKSTKIIIKNQIKSRGRGRGYLRRKLILFYMTIQILNLNFESRTQRFIP
jgi:hypothetical protein